MKTSSKTYQDYLLKPYKKLIHPIIIIGMFLIIHNIYTLDANA